MTKLRLALFLQLISLQTHNLRLLLTSVWKR